MIYQELLEKIGDLAAISSLSLPLRKINFFRAHSNTARSIRQKFVLLISNINFGDSQSA
jgi:hypothetical protein